MNRKARKDAVALLSLLLVSAALVGSLPRSAYSVSPQSIVQIKEKSALSSSGTIHVLPTSDVAKGDLLVLTFASNSSGDGVIDTLADNLTDPWTFRVSGMTSCFGDVSIRCDAEIWVANATSNGPVNIAITPTGATSGYYAVFYELRGYTDAVLPMHTGAGTSTPTAVTQTGGYPPNALIIATVSNFNDSGAWTAGAGFTRLTGSATPLFSAEYRAGFNGNSSVPFAYSGYLDWVEAAAAFAPMQASTTTETTTETETTTATVTSATTGTATLTQTTNPNIGLCDKMLDTRGSDGNESVTIYKCMDMVAGTWNVTAQSSPYSYVSIGAYIFSPSTTYVSTAAYDESSSGNVSLSLPSLYGFRMFGAAEGNCPVGAQNFTADAFAITSTIGILDNYRESGDVNASKYALSLSPRVLCDPTVGTGLLGGIAVAGVPMSAFSFSADFSHLMPSYSMTFTASAGEVGIVIIAGGYNPVTASEVFLQAASTVTATATVTHSTMVISYAPTTVTRVVAVQAHSGSSGSSGSGGISSITGDLIQVVSVVVVIGLLGFIMATFKKFNISR